jgi:glycosyltransferase involved in cell wall biosynthesis
MIYLYSDTLIQSGGIETYLHALALHLKQQQIACHVVVTEMEPCPLLDELEEKGIPLYRQPRVLGDRWFVRQRVMMTWLVMRLKPGDWVYCVRPAVPALYLALVRWIHRRRAKIAVSWMLAPEFLHPNEEHFSRAVAETDVVISVSHCTVAQFKQFYGYTKPVHVVPYHNQLQFSGVVPLPAHPPWKIGYMGRLEIYQKNLDTLLDAFAMARHSWPNTELHFYGSGNAQEALSAIAHRSELDHCVFFHGGYDHRHDLADIVANCHFFVYPSRFEGGPCFTLLELLQAGRFCIASNVGGIPDLYTDHPEAGLMVAPDDREGLSKALIETLERLETGEIDGNRVRDRYVAGFDMDAAHRKWLSALKLS